MLALNWTHSGTAFVAAFLASAVEFVEAFTIVLAVGTTRGWRSALFGTAAGATLLVLLLLTFGPALQRIPLTTLQLVVGVLLLLFGMRWLRKAILRSAGIIALHDEAATFEKEIAILEQDGAGSRRLDWVAFVASFKAVTLEGLEVVFIVIATGVGGALVLATLGATAAAVLVVLAAIALKAPLARVPENTLKLSVGVLLSAFGVFWIGEGLHFEWLGHDLALVALIAGFLLVARVAVISAKSVARSHSTLLDESATGAP